MQNKFNNVLCVIVVLVVICVVVGWGNSSDVNLSQGQQSAVIFCIIFIFNNVCHFWIFNGHILSILHWKCSWTKLMCRFSWNSMSMGRVPIIFLVVLACAFLCQMLRPKFALYSERRIIISYHFHGDFFFLLRHIIKIDKTLWINISWASTCAVYVTTVTLLFHRFHHCPSKYSRAVQPRVQQWRCGFFYSYNAVKEVNYLC